MDAIKGLANKAKEMKGGSSSEGSKGGMGGILGGDDPVDKGLAAAEKQTGMSQNPLVNEQITDRGREMFEKGTGQNVPDKISH